MMRYFLCFEPGDPNPEDQHVRAYLRDHGLDPKRAWTGERGGVACEVLQYGGCYLGSHLRAIHRLRHRGIVAEAVGAWLRETNDPALATGGLDGAQMQDVAWVLAGVVLKRDAVRPGGDDPTHILLDVDVLRGELPEAVRAAVRNPSAITTSGEEA